MGNTNYDQEFIDNAIEAFKCLDSKDKEVQKYLIIAKREDDWQKTYASFYGLNPIRSDEFKQEYFEYLEKNEDKKPGFEEALNKICGISGKTDLSFTTKLLHTINPDEPIWDSRIERVLEERLLKESNSLSIRLAETKYQLLKEFYEELFDSGEGQKYIDAFDEEFSNLSKEDLDSIPDIKKIDFVLWAYGKSLIDGKSKK